MSSNQHNYLHGMSTFSFSFSGEDIEENFSEDLEPHVSPPPSHAAETGTLRRASNSAFPITGQPLLPPRSHSLESMLNELPSKIAYSTLVVKLDDGKAISIPRRELWDVRVQLMAEDDDEGLGNLGKDDVRTGVYEGGFKSWESSVDVVKVLNARRRQLLGFASRTLELGCGTALPSLALFQWLLDSPSPAPESQFIKLDLGLADYNPTVLQLVTLPNLILTWAQVRRKSSWVVDGELEIDSDLIQDFLGSLKSFEIRLSFFSGAWGPQFANLVIATMGSEPAPLTIIGAETIYSPAALRSFANTLVSLLAIMPGGEKTSLVAAKKVYFGVGGSIEDFCDAVRAKAFDVEQIREESDGVRRVVVEVKTKG